MGKKPAILRLLRSTALPHVRTRDRRGLPPRCQMGLATKSQVLRMAQNRSNILVNSNKRHILHTHIYIQICIYHISHLLSYILWYCLPFVKSMVREAQELSRRQGGTDYECTDLVKLPAEAAKNTGDVWKIWKNDEFFFGMNTLNFPWFVMVGVGFRWFQDVDFLGLYWKQTIPELWSLGDLAWFQVAFVCGWAWWWTWFVRRLQHCGCS